MKNNGKFSVCYNTQVLVDSKSHIVVNYKAGTNPGDIGSIEEISKEAKEMLGKEGVIKNITDQGYKDRKDMSRCLETGIIPEVTLGKEEKGYEVEFEYEEKEISEEERKSEKVEDIKKCLRAGVIPKVYEEYLSEIKVIEKTKCETIEEVQEQIEEIDDNTRRNIAISNKCFVKDREGNKVYCPEGETLRPKSRHQNGIKYCNKLACKNCKNPCTISLFKELTMRSGQIISSSDKELKKKYNAKKKIKREKIKVVVCRLTPKEEDTKKRMSISEHSHGTMKRSDDMSYFLLKGVDNVNGELAIYYCASNIRRVINILGVEEIMEYLRSKKEEKVTNCKNIVNNIKNILKKMLKKDKI